MLLGIAEIDTDDRIKAWVTFDLEDFDAAIAELDARYIACEAAAHAQTWSVIMGAMPRSTGASCLRPRRTAKTSTTAGRPRSRPASSTHTSVPRWMSGQDNNIYIETVHRFSVLGAVFTYVGHGISHEGFDAEWRGPTC